MHLRARNMTMWLSMPSVGVIITCHATNFRVSWSM